MILAALTIGLSLGEVPQDARLLALNDSKRYPSDGSLIESNASAPMLGLREAVEYIGRTIRGLSMSEHVPYDDFVDINDIRN